MERMEWIAPCHFGLESVLKGRFRIWICDRTGGRWKSYLLGGADAACRANVFIRTAERVLLKAGSFKAVTFDELFEKYKSNFVGELYTEEWEVLGGESFIGKE